MAVVGHAPLPTPWLSFLGSLFLSQSTLAQVPLEGGEHFYTAEMQYTAEEMVNSKGVTFQLFWTCSKTHEIALQDTLVEEPGNPATDLEMDEGLSFSTWSHVVEEFSFYNELQLEGDPEMMKFYKELEEDRHSKFIRFALLISVLLLIVFQIFYFMLQMFLGIYLGRALMWAVRVSVQPIKDFGRSLVIKFFWTLRVRTDYLYNQPEPPEGIEMV